jgi:hypothetical protein
MTGTIRLRARHRRPAPVLSTSFVAWSVAMVVVSAAAGVVLALALSGA